MKRRFTFMAGLPRSGSTLLSSILNQNPEIHSGANSPVLGLMANVERSVLYSEQFNAYPKIDVVPQLTRGLLEAWYSDRTEPVVVDKCREWAMPDYYQCLERNLGYPAKVIMPVRSIVDILASYISLIHRNPDGESFIDKEIENSNEFHMYRPIDDIRCDYLMSPKGLVDNALFGIAYALTDDMRDRFHFIEYEDMLANPEKEMDAIYKFLDMPSFGHDFTAISNDFPEDDKVYGLQGMHDVRQSLSRRSINTDQVLSSYVRSKYSGLEFWRA